jgi:hypothetical protein
MQGLEPSEPFLYFNWIQSVCRDLANTERRVHGFPTPFDPHIALCCEVNGIR